MTKRFLIGQLARYGDCLYATTVARQIKNDFPESHITWAIASQYKSIIEGNPYVDAIWEIIADPKDFYRDAWNAFEEEAQRRKLNNEFDELVFTQFPDKYWIRFNGTIRSSILSGYTHKITVPVAPVVRLTDNDIQSVKDFALLNNLSSYRHVILFECNPGSMQSFITPLLAVEIAQSITAAQKDVCFIMTSMAAFKTVHPQIISASSLSFKQNAELTKYCTLLIGCSSGITWLATSDWAKKLDTIQLLSKDFSLFAGVKYDLKQWGVSTENVIEVTSSDRSYVTDCIKKTLQAGFEIAKKNYDELLQPSYKTFETVMTAQILRKRYILQVPSFIYRFYRHNKHLSLAKLVVATFKIIVGFVFKNNADK